jgi:hypothetical protein
MFTIP